MADYRFVRTDEDIQRAFLKILTKSSFETLTIAQVAKASRVNRSTFYAHYDSLYDLAQQVIDQEIQVLEQQLSASIGVTNTQTDDLYGLFSGVLGDYLIGQAATINEIRLISLGTNSFDPRCRQLFETLYQRVLGVEAGSFTAFLLVNMAMSDLDFILLHKRAPERRELTASLTQLSRIAARITDE